MSSNGLSSFAKSASGPWMWALVALLLAPLYAVRLNEVPVGAVTDDAYYIEMARSTAEGLGPVINTGPEAQSHDPGIFPPGYPFLLSPLAKLFPSVLLPLRIVGLLAALALIPLCWRLPGKDSPAELRLAVVAVFMLNPWTVSWSGRILSDIPYTALSLGALMLFIRMQSQPASSSWRGRVALVLLCALAVSVRTIGWAAVLAMAVVLLTQRRWLAALVLPILVAAVGWLTALPQATGAALVSQGYTAQMFSHKGVSVFRFAWENVAGYVAQVPAILLPIFGNPAEALFKRVHLDNIYPAIVFVIGAAVLAVAGYAISRHWQQKPGALRWRLFSLYLAFYGSALALFDGYPSGVQVRLLIPVLPILAWLVLSGVWSLLGRERSTGPRVVVAMMLLAALAHNGWRIARPLHSSVEADGHGLVNPQDGAAWIVGNTISTDIILVQDTLARHVHFMRPVVGFPGALDAAALAWQVKLYNVQYVFVGPAVHHQPHRLDAKGQALLEILQSQPALYNLVHTDTTCSLHIFHCAQN